MTPDATRLQLRHVADLVADHIERRRGDPVASAFDPGALRAAVAEYDFSLPRDAGEIADELFDLLRRTGIRSDHPRYFGLFNPPAMVPGIIGDVVAATVNPQLAVWGHAPAAAEIERHVAAQFSDRIWNKGTGGGMFTSGGSEANHTAVLTALATRYPDWSTRGIGGLDRRPVIYVSAQAHLAWIKIARAAGLGSESVRLVETRNGMALDGPTLRAAIARDSGTDPVLVVATAGTTAHGAIDDLEGIAQVGHEHSAHVHVDAAWAGSVVLDPAHSKLLSGIDAADSVTIDPHKWLAVPMGAGLYLTRDMASLAAPFAVETGYMPPGTDGMRDAYAHSLQWSRRFIGAKLFVALATLGLDGYAAMISRQIALGQRLRSALAVDGWRIVNDTALPVVCFMPTGEGDVARIAESLTASGEAWLSTVVLRGQPCLRACITSFETTAADVDRFVALLADARARDAG